MRTVLSVGGLRTIVSNLEHTIIVKINAAGSVSSNDLTSNESNAARLLVSRGVLTQKVSKNEITYFRNQPKGIPNATTTH